MCIGLWIDASLWRGLKPDLFPLSKKIKNKEYLSHSRRYDPWNGFSCVTDTQAYDLSVRVLLQVSLMLPANLREDQDQLHMLALVK